MRVERVALLVDAAFLALAWWWIGSGRGDIGLSALLLLIVLVALPAPGRAMGPVALLIAAGVLIGTLALTAGPPWSDPIAGAVDPATAVAITLVAGALVAILWLLLWRGVVDRPAPWKPLAFSASLVLFLLAPALALAASGPVTPDPDVARLAIGASAFAVACAAGLPYADGALKRTRDPPVPSPRKRL